MSSKTWSETGRRTPTSDRDGTEDILHAFLRRFAMTFRHARERRDLANLSEHSLRDIGLTRADVDLELRKPVWRD
ncbi:MAG TPA: DUF1127 domain-containing protein [Candidatus Binatia bacterium]|nr:DUF1127 domain-containing protein [Candidatus Binatia bacterium]